ncbi:Sugar lactone lactonase YvrE [Cohaesibacter marisflavi]|uniref:Sugar lactone lactonase YvrE n=1 Tax=Cohaesibacter marisflavi TaxID=655353 RepID=A0A1I5J243_9HYPH|nr:SMP-30/gluconolactonase/LRE family protein [Cohaesibacter marisflavi]SFO66875.1 Sugar lactone lactonase YvrE [Cohaesibacter marisflavi]
MPLFDDRLCTLGEGPLWHPLRKQLFWFDIMGKTLLTRTGDSVQSWTFDEYVSAGGWVDKERILIASYSSLFVFNVETGAQEKLCDLEADKPENRCNDGRADPYGGFWIGTMGIKSEPGAGAFYRYYRGELRKLYANITITNGACFSADRQWACFTDTKSRQMMRVALDSQGWPKGEPEVYLDFRADDLNIDGTVFDVAGNVWIAHWGIHAVRAYGPDGKQVHEEVFPVTRVSCPAFGGDDFKTLYVTSARSGAKEEELAREPLAGATFACRLAFEGQAENQILLA